MPADETSVRSSVPGPVRAWRGEQEPDPGSPQRRVVLAALLPARGRPAALGELIRAHLLTEHFPGRGVAGPSGAASAAPVFSDWRRCGRIFPSV
ncbi:hypothetical protein B7767_37150 [Streptomyces sp. 13-12-16]|nr:hypothetical protein B7767_37150 [Streptomyces sp. 13-12-16]